MGLTYDSSAVRYASTQEAYGCTWTLDKIENDGAQVWRNAKGQEAIVHKVCEQVKQNHREYQDPVWKLTNFGQGNAFEKAERKPIKSDNLGHFQPDPPYGKRV